MSDLLMRVHPSAENEGFLYRYQLDLPDGVEFCKYKKYGGQDGVTFYGYKDGDEFVELFAVHSLWGPSDGKRGQRHKMTLQNYAVVTREELTALWDNPWSV